ncbi:substrate-binding domain-containing protein [Paramagnetospirillum magneticum]|uniref:ABC-type phosphate transport system n=1 Tax=Paramagnetospirillum magneticum (strain ATCC 700264 / AMB-1) TaxID=342108 RepID=Q2W3R6_PARM1|nr:substrate-binding domain-containing protein [Paramagnetospirillum magneticum]BAE51509.1 ABC-type phosphate transport system [Paramagnetospirillum magneticum AMB-1]
MGLYRGVLLFGLAIGLLAVPAHAEPIRAAGTGMGLALVRLLAERYQQDHPGISVWIPESVGTAGAVRGLQSGKVDVGILARPLKPGEVEGGVSHLVCRTPLVFFTNAARQDVTLGRSDLAALFGNSLPAFPKGEVRALLRPASDAGFVHLIEIYPDLAPAVSAARDARGANLALTDQDAMEAVEISRSLVAFGAFAPLVAEKRKLVAVPLDGVMPGVDTLESGRYPHALPLVLGLAPKASAEARAFVDFARSPAAATLLRANGCLPGGSP